MKSVRPPFFFRWFDPDNLFCEDPRPDKVIYLTFDDGPVAEITPEVLRILSDFSARATFFMVGDNVKKHADIYKLVVDGGHAAGNHTFHHLNGWKTPAGAYAEDVFRCDDILHSRLFRPPYGRFTPAQYFLLKKHFRFIMWSVLTRDFDRRTSPGQCLKNALSNSRQGSVVVFHDSLKAAGSLFYALPRFLEYFSGKGFRFEAMENETVLPGKA